MKNAWTFLFLVILAVAKPARTSWCQSVDTTAPNLLSVDLTPASADVSTSSANIRVRVHLSDDQSGVSSWSTTLRSPSGLQTLVIGASSGLASGTATDGFFEATSTLVAGSEQGAWAASVVTVTDAAGNSADVDLSRVGIFLLQVGPGLEDVTPPNLVAAGVSPQSLDVTSADAQATITAALTDDLSGVEFARIYYYSPSRNLSTTTYLWLNSGTAQDGLFQGTVQLKQHAEPGLWTPSSCYDHSFIPPRRYSCMEVQDKVGNSVNIDLEARGIDLKLEVMSSMVDMKAPDVINVSTLRDTVDVTDFSDIVPVSANLTDDISGVHHAYMALVSPSGRRSTNAYFLLESGTPQDGFFSGAFGFPQYTEPGTWRPSSCYDYNVTPARQYPCMYVEDQVGNWGAFDLAANGIDLTVRVISPVEDLEVPRFVGMSLSPSAIDISQGDALIETSVNLTDDLSGIQRAYVRFDSPSGRRSTDTQVWLNAGIPKNGVFQGTLLFPRYTEPGIWRPFTCNDFSADPPRPYPCMYVEDMVGNGDWVDMGAAGTALKLTVLSVPSDMSLTLEPASSVNDVGTSHSVVARVSRGTVPVSGATVIFEIVDGPHRGTVATASSDASGETTFTYIGIAAGTDTIVASVDVEGDGEVDAAGQATKEWQLLDSDADGVTDDHDRCPGTPAGEPVDAGGCSASQRDSDGDGVLNTADNCPLVANADQADNDGDGLGNACDPDDDDDGVADPIDNCPLAANPNQSDFDADGVGDACDVDADGDGVVDAHDMCLWTSPGQAVDPASGCSVAQLCPCAGPRGQAVKWRNHGQYVSCTAKSSEKLLDLGVINQATKDLLVSGAAKSTCGGK